MKVIAPDAIFITGDFIDSNRYNLEQSLLLVEALQFVAPMYYVTGNHEIATNDSERIKGSLKELGVRCYQMKLKSLQYRRMIPSPLGDWKTLGKWHRS